MTSNAAIMAATTHEGRRDATQAERFALGSVAACVAVVATNPIEVVKTRIMAELQSGPPSSTPPRRAGVKVSGFRAAPPPRPGVVRVTREAWRHEGIAAFYGGAGAALWRAATYGGVRLGTYEALRNGLLGAATSVLSGRQQSFVPAGPSHTSDSDLPSGVRPACKLLAGMVSGGTGAVVGNPFDVVKVRRQVAQHNGTTDATATTFAPGASSWSATTLGRMATIAQTEGARALWAGVSAGVARSAVLTAAQVAVYDEAKQALRRLGQAYSVFSALGRDGLVLQVTTAMVAGVVSTTATNPFDLLKTRQMNARCATSSATARAPGRQPAARVTNPTLWGGLRQIVREEGPSALLRGWGAAWLRVGPNTIVVLLVYDGARAALGLRSL